MIKQFYGYELVNSQLEGDNWLLITVNDSQIFDIDSFVPDTSVKMLIKVTSKFKLIPLFFFVNVHKTSYNGINNQIFFHFVVLFSKN